VHALAFGTLQQITRNYTIIPPIKARVRYRI
jgi:hypothetical protein